MSKARDLHPHYHKPVAGLDFVDVYRVLELFNVTNPCIQHAVKKLLVAGGRGAGKDISRDIQEAVDSLCRWNEMRQEDADAEGKHNRVSIDDPSLRLLLGIRVIDWPTLIHVQQLFDIDVLDDGNELYPTCLLLATKYLQKYDSKNLPGTAPHCTAADWDRFSQRWLGLLANSYYPFDLGEVREAFNKTKDWYYG